MKSGLTDVEGRALHGLIEEASGDIVIRLDARGFLVDASSNISDLGTALADLLVLPHVADLAQAGHREAVWSFVRTVLEGVEPCKRIEFPILAPGEPAPTSRFDAGNWYSLSLRRIDAGDNHDGSAARALGLLRSVQHRRSLEAELHSHAITDPLTGLPSRHAFSATVQRALTRGGDGMVALLAIDRMRALRMQYGQRAADEILWGFARFIETMAAPDFEIGQVDNDRLAVIMPALSESAARAWASEAIGTFSALAVPPSPRGPKLTASAGLARLETSVDHTLRQAELGLVMARAAGGRQVGRCAYISRNVRGVKPVQSRQQSLAIDEDDLGVRAAAR